MASTPFEVTLAVPSEREFEQTLHRAVEERVASRIAGQDPTLWGEDAESEAKVRLAWTSLATTSRPLVQEISTLRAELNDRGLDHVVLCGMGGSSLAPEVICATAGVELTVLDTSQPDMVAPSRGRPTRAQHRRGVQQVRRHGRDRQPEAHLRAGHRQRRDGSGRPHRRRHRPGLTARPGGDRGGLPGLPRRPERRRPLLRPHRLRPGAGRPRRRADRRAARRGRGGSVRARRRQWRQPGVAARRRAGRSQPARGRQARARRPDPPRARRLDRAARRRVHRQAGQGDPAGRRPVRERRQLQPEHRRHRPRRPGQLRRTRGPVRLVRRRAWRAGCPDARLGDGSGRGRTAHRHQPVRPARRRERQAGRPRPAGRAAATPSSPTWSRAGSPRSARRPPTSRRPSPTCWPSSTCSTATSLSRPISTASDWPSTPASARFWRDAPGVRSRSAGVHDSCTPPGSTTRAARAPASTSSSRPTRSTTSPSPAEASPIGEFIASQAAGDASVLRRHGRPVLRLHLSDAEAALPDLRELLLG